MVVWTGLLDEVRGDISRLDYVTRYSSIPTRTKETVSQHSFWVGLYAVMIHRMLRDTYVGIYAWESVEYQILKYALVHDVGESVTGDVVRPFKYATPEMKRAADEAEDILTQRLMPDVVKQIIGELDDPRNTTYSEYVKDVIKAADFLCVYVFMNREFLHGNQEIEPFRKRMVADMTAMAAKLGLSPGAHVKEISRLYTLMASQSTRKFVDREI